MADIAAVFHWPPAAMDEMPIEELMMWQRLAIARHKVMRGDN